MKSGTLEQLIDQRRQTKLFTFDEALQIMRGIAAQAINKYVIYRNIKPGNILFDDFLNEPRPNFI